MGKFRSSDDEQVYEWTLEGTEDECGSVLYGGWCGLVILSERDASMLEDDAVRACIVHEDSQGFVDVDYYQSTDEARADWDEIRESTSEPHY